MQSQRTVSTCWDDIGTGVMVECTRESSTTSVGATPATLGSNTSRTELVAQGRSGQAPPGPAVRRFAGTWTVQFSGDDSARCDNIRVALDGAITGSCNFGLNYPVSGRITDSGAVTVTVSNGAELIGSAGSPIGASGSWKLGNASGNWSASHR